MSKQNERIVELQRQLKITRGALERIANMANDPVQEAQDALDKLSPLDKKGQLQGITGHLSQRERRELK